MEKETIEYLAGFFDGDGCISSRKTATPSSVRASVSQSRDAGEPEELRQFQRYYGGRISKTNQKRNSNNRERWMWSPEPDQLSRFLADMRAHSIVKAPQLQLALDLLGCASKEERIGLAARMSDWKKRYHEVPIDKERITMPYLAGLFAAEGSANLTGKETARISIQIAKSSCPALLDAIKEKVGFGYIAKQSGCFCVAAKNAVRFAASIQPHLVGQKVPQLEILLRWQAQPKLVGLKGTERAGKKRSAGWWGEYDHVREELKRMKRT